MRNSGFTLIELIVVMVIIVVLAVVAIPRFFDRADFDNLGFRDQTLAILRHAQKIAIVQRRTVCVSFTSNSVTLVMATNAGATTCATAIQLTSPTGTTPYKLSVSTNSVAAYSTFPAAGFNFDSLGRAVIGGSPVQQTIQVAGLPAFTVEGETGYVHP